MCACLLSVVDWNKRTRGNGSQAVAREMPAGPKKEFCFVKMVVHPNRMPGEALASPSSRLPGGALSLLPERCFRVPYALGRRVKKECPRVPSCPNLSMNLWLACFQHSSDEQIGRNACDSSVPELPQITQAFIPVLFITAQP